MIWPGLAVASSYAGGGPDGVLSLVVSVIVMKSEGFVGNGSWRREAWRLACGSVAADQGEEDDVKQCYSGVINEIQTDIVAG